jgi:hypothetical protein
MQLFVVEKQMRAVPVVAGKTGTDDDHWLQLETIGTVEAESPEDALVKAKQLKEFRYGKGLGRHPIVSPL